MQDWYFSFLEQGKHCPIRSQAIQCKADEIPKSSELVDGTSSNTMQNYGDKYVIAFFAYFFLKISLIILDLLVHYARIIWFLYFSLLI